TAGRAQSSQLRTGLGQERFRRLRACGLQSRHPTRVGRFEALVKQACAFGAHMRNEPVAMPGASAVCLPRATLRARPAHRNGMGKRDMADNKREDGGRLFFTSEVFKDGAGGNYSDTIGGEQGLELFGGGKAQHRKGPRPTRTYLEPAREIPVF